MKPKDDRESIKHLAQTGQVAKFEDLESLVFAFEKVLQRHGISIKSGRHLKVVPSWKCWARNRTAASANHRHS